MKILAMFLKKILKNFSKDKKSPAVVCVQSGVHWVLFSSVVCVSSRRGGLRIGRENFFCGLSLSSKKCYSSKITFLSVFYHDCIKDFCKERHFSAWGKRKIVVTGKPCGGRNKGIGGKKRQPELSRLPVCFFVDNFRKGYHLRYAPLYPQHCNVECCIAYLWCWSARFYSSVIYPVGNGLHCGMCKGHTASRPFLSWFPKDGHILSFFRLPFFRLVLV